MAQRQRRTVPFAREKRSAMAALTRRRILTGSAMSLGLTALFGRGAPAAPATADDFVIVDGWVLRRSDLNLLR
jgi:hypothetical protein